jgi:hypothetical protein
MAEINSIAQGTYTLGQTSATTYQAGPGISITQPSEGIVRISNDETVLWSGTATSGDITLSETYKNFEKFGIVHGCTYSYNDRGVAPDSIFDVDTFKLYNCGQIITTDMTKANVTPPTGTNTIYTTYTQFSAVNDTKLHFAPAQVVFNTVAYNTNNVSVTGKWAYENSRRYFKIYGINRISGGNA